MFHLNFNNLRTLFLCVLICFSCCSLSVCGETEKEPGILAATHTTLVSGVGPPGAPLDIMSPIEAMGYGDFRGVIHAHSYLSHDSEGTPARMIEAAQTVGAQFVLMSDHRSPYSVSHGLRGFHGGILFLPGLELGADDGSLLAMNLRENISAPDTQGIIDAVNEQGGIAFLSHIEGIKNWNLTGWAGMEIYNVHYDAIMDGKIDKTVAVIRLIDKDPDRVWLSILDRPDVYLEAWDKVLQKRRATGIAANDSHANVVYNGVLLDTYERSYGLVNTHLFLMELSEDGIMDALERGHAYVCFEVFSGCRGFSLTASDDENIAIMGDEFALKPDAAATLQIRVPKKAKIKLLKDGEVIEEVMGRELALDLKEPGVYRVEVYVRHRKKTQPWIISNPIYVR